MKPYMFEDSENKIEYYQTQINKHTEESIKITPGEAKRIELIRKMKEDTDKKEYMIMTNVFTLCFVLLTITHIIITKNIWSLASMVLLMAFYILLRYKLRMNTLSLAQYKNDFDTYLWEGFYLKEMRHSAIKLQYIIFFPAIMVIVSDLLFGTLHNLPLWLNFCISAVISTIGWLVFFEDDRQHLEQLETELNSLKYL